MLNRENIHDMWHASNLGFYYFVNENLYVQKIRFEPEILCQYYSPTYGHCPIKVYVRDVYRAVYRAVADFVYYSYRLKYGTFSERISRAPSIDAFVKIHKHICEGLYIIC